MYLCDYLSDFHFSLSTGSSRMELVKVRSKEIVKSESTRCLRNIMQIPSSTLVSSDPNLWVEIRNLCFSHCLNDAHCPLLCHCLQLWNGLGYQLSGGASHKDLKDLMGRWNSMRNLFLRRSVNTVWIFHQMGGFKKFFLSPRQEDLWNECTSFLCPQEVSETLGLSFLKIKFRTEEFWTLLF